MSEVTKRVVTTDRYEYVVPSPAPKAEIEKAIAMALHDMLEERRRFDDACKVEAYDDEIVVWWEVRRG